jgi:hypothetical protein
MGGFTPFVPPVVLQLQAQVPVAGYVMQNASVDVTTWNVPNDGQEHRFLVVATLTVTVTEVGGAVVVNWTAPDGTVSAGITAIAGGKAAGLFQGTVGGQCLAGTVVAVHQAALTGGAAKLWADTFGI